MDIDKTERLHRQVEVTGRRVISARKATTPPEQPPIPVSTVDLKTDIPLSGITTAVLDPVTAERRQVEAVLQQQLSQMKLKMSELEARHQEALTLIRRYEEDRDNAYVALSKKATEEASERWRTEYEEKLASAKALIGAFSGTVAERLKQNDAVILDIVWTALVKLVGQQYARAHFPAALLEQALAQLKHPADVRILMHPQDYARLDEILGFVGQDLEFEFAIDHRVDIGGFIIETSSGHWDARLDTQLLRLREAIHASVERVG